MPAVTRQGDNDVVHCSRPVRDEHSPNVLCNGIHVSRETDRNTPHLLTEAVCVIHRAPIAIGSTNTFCNALGTGRIGDEIEDCTSVAEGSPNVFAGE